MRFALRAAAIVAGLIACLPLHYVWKLARRPSPWPRRFLWWVGRSAGMKVRSVGRPLARNVLFLANHMSWLDIMVLAGESGTAFVSKDDLGHGFVHWLADLNHTVYVKRECRTSDLRSTQRALRSIKGVKVVPIG